jgi:hypothetical protein
VDCLALLTAGAILPFAATVVFLLWILIYRRAP